MFEIIRRIHPRERASSSFLTERQFLGSDDFQLTLLQFQCQLPEIVPLLLQLTFLLLFHYLLNTLRHLAHELFLLSLQAFLCHV